MRLLALLEAEELTVAELASITDLKQPRVSTHLSKLKEAGLVNDRRAGVQAYYRSASAELSIRSRNLLAAVRESADDALLLADRVRMAKILRQRGIGASWADSVAGDMERHYSPGRTWDAVARVAIELVQLGDVLDLASGDGAIAELLSPHAKSVICVDASSRVVEAARVRLSALRNVQVLQSDMHTLPLAPRSLDLALMLQALPYSESPLTLFAELARVLRPGGRVLGTALGKHAFEDAVVPYGHRNLGFDPAELKALLSQSGFVAIKASIATRELRAPHFDIVLFSAELP